MYLPEPYTFVPHMHHAIAERRAALSAEHIIFPNSYRIGDCIGLLTLRNWLEAWHDVYDFSLVKPCPVMKVLQPFAVFPFEFGDAANAPEEAKVFDDNKPSIWYWQSYFKHIGFRLEFATDKVREYDIVFAPLLDADYSTERALHPVFAHALAKWLEVTYPGRVLILADGWCPADMERFAGLNVQTLPLETAIEHIGSCKTFIGCDTGLSHIAACFDIQQVALYSAQNTAVHAARESGDMRTHAEILEALTGFYGHYDAAPNQAPDRLTVLQFNHGGMDRVTLPATMNAVQEIMQ